MRRAFAPDLALGGLLVAIGAAAAWIASGYPQGTLRFMGPGYAPLWLGLIILCLGLAIMARGVRAAGERSPDPSPVPWRALLLVAVAPLVFGLVVPKGGLVLASLATALTVSAAIPGMNLRKALTTAAALAGGFTLIFAVLLKVPLSVWPS